MILKNGFVPAYGDHSRRKAKISLHRRLNLVKSVADLSFKGTDCHSPFGASQ